MQSVDAIRLVDFVRASDGGDDYDAFVNCAIYYRGDGIIEKVIVTRFYKAVPQSSFYAFKFEKLPRVKHHRMLING